MLNKIWIRIQMLTNWVFWWLDLLWEVELCWEWARGDCLLQKKCIRKKEKWGRGRWGEEGQLPSHKLNIIDGITNKIILLVNPSIILLVKISHHRTICLFESHCNSVVIPSVYTDGIFYQYLPMDTGMKNYVGKGHRDIPMEFFVSFSVCIWQFSGSDQSKNSNLPCL